MRRRANFSAIMIGRRPAADAASGPPRYPASQVACVPIATAFLFLARNRTLGLHTTSERRNLKTPGLRVRFQFQSILSPAGCWSYSRRPLFIVERAFSAL